MSSIFIEDFPPTPIPPKVNLEDDERSWPTTTSAAAAVAGASATTTTAKISHEMNDIRMAK